MPYKQAGKHSCPKKLFPNMSFFVTVEFNFKSCKYQGQKSVLLKYWPLFACVFVSSYFRNTCIFLTNQNKTGKEKVFTNFFSFYLFRSLMKKSTLRIKKRMKRMRKNLQMQTKKQKKKRGVQQKILVNQTMRVQQLHGCIM